jgi:hypothetical protein
MRRKILVVPKTEPFGFTRISEIVGKGEARLAAGNTMEGAVEFGGGFDGGMDVDGRFDEI